MSPRNVMGIVLLAGLALFAGLSATGAYALWRTSAGIAEAEPNLEILTQHAVDAFQRRGALCGSSRFASHEPFGEASWTMDSYEAKLATAEERDDVGFHCLGVERTTLSSGQDGYVYEATKDTFVVRAFRAYLYDPAGKLPRYERRGRVVAGRIEVDSSLYRVEPGGERFPGHDEREACSYCQSID